MIEQQESVDVSVVGGPTEGTIAAVQTPRAGATTARGREAVTPWFPRRFPCQ